MLNQSKAAIFMEPVPLYNVFSIPREPEMKGTLWALTITSGPLSQIPVSNHLVFIVMTHSKAVVFMKTMPLYKLNAVFFHIIYIKTILHIW